MIDIDVPLLHKVTSQSLILRGCLKSKSRRTVTKILPIFLFFLVISSMFWFDYFLSYSLLYQIF